MVSYFIIFIHRSKKKCIISSRKTEEISILEHGSQRVLNEAQATSFKNLYIKNKTTKQAITALRTCNG